MNFPGRILIVSPHFPPVNAPDMQRVRHGLPYFVEAGWEVTVLTVDDPTPLAPVEPELLETVPATVRVVRARCCSRRWTRWLGVGNTALRALPFLFLAGCRLLSGRRQDVVYFSTTMFIVLPFGRIWRRLYGVPYVIDLQDPWVSDYYERPDAPRPPGGWKYRIAQGVGRLLEGWTLRHAAHLITVSPAYGTALCARHPELSAMPCTELPFGPPEAELAHLRATKRARTSLLPDAGFTLAFAGALGPGMFGPVEVLFAAMAVLRHEGVCVSAHFFGTSYAPGGKASSVLPQLATRYGLLDCVTEHPGRVPYLTALSLTLEAGANLLLDSSDPGFTPSKILGVQAAGRPVLALVYPGSAMAIRLEQLGIPAVPLSGDAGHAPTVASVADSLRRLISDGHPPPPPPPHLSARVLARRQMEIFSQSLTA